MVRSTRPGKSSNLFAVDHEVVAQTLAEANHDLLRERDELLAAFDRMPSPLSGNAEIDKGRRFQMTLLAALDAARAARLADGRAFTDATATVKGFFAPIELDLKTMAEAVQLRLTEAALKTRPSTTVGVNLEGKPVVLAAVPSEETERAAVTLPLQWTITQVDRTLLDLEALRPFLTDSALLYASRKHMEAHGPNRLPGVDYRQVVAPP